MDYLMGIDLGSTSLKAVIYDRDGSAVARGSRPTERFHPHSEHPEWTVWDPEQIWGGTAAAIRDALAALDDPGQVKAVAVTGMGMDGVPVDEEGKWLYPFISWHDPRTGPQLDWWQENIGAEKVFSIGGNPLWPINSALRILWVAQNEPEVFARTEKWLLIEDFLNFMLSGRRATDYSMASCTLLFDQRKLDWSDQMLEASGIDRRLMCDAHPAGTVLGEVTAGASNATGLAPGTPVVLGGHDHLCGALPVGAFRPGVVLDVTGTWEIVRASGDGRNRAGPRRPGQVCHVGLQRGRRDARVVPPAVRRGSRAQGGAGRRLGLGPPDGRGGRLAARIARRHVPAAHVGSKLPGRRPPQPGGIRGTGQPGHDYQFLDIVTAMESGLGVKLEKFVAVGGAVRNELWMQNKTDVVGRPIEVPEIEEATPLGAAILAGIGIGLYRDEQDAFEHVYRPGRTFQPDPELSARYAEWFQTYRELYPALGPISRRLG